MVQSLEGAVLNQKGVAGRLRKLRDYSVKQRGGRERQERELSAKHRRRRGHGQEVAWIGGPRTDGLSPRRGDLLSRREAPSGAAERAEAGAGVRLRARAAPTPSSRAAARGRRGAGFCVVSVWHLLPFNGFGRVPEQSRVASS